MHLSKCYEYLWGNFFSDRSDKAPGSHLAYFYHWSGIWEVLSGIVLSREFLFIVKKTMPTSLRKLVRKFVSQGKLVPIHFLQTSISSRCWKLTTGLVIWSCFLHFFTYLYFLYSIKIFFFLLSQLSIPVVLWSLFQRLQYRLNKDKPLNFHYIENDSLALLTFLYFPLVRRNNIIL